MSEKQEIEDVHHIHRLWLQIRKELRLSEVITLALTEPFRRRMEESKKDPRRMVRFYVTAFCVIALFALLIARLLQ